MASKLSLFLAEFKRRKVFHVAAVYGAVGVAISLGVPDLFSAFDLPNSAARFVIVLIAVGFPIALVLAWAYEVRPEEPRTEKPAVAPGQVEDRKSIVVLPFDNMSPDPGDAYFADGLTEEIITNLSHITSLRVISRSSAMVLKGTQKEVRTIGKEMDVQYVLEGSVRKAGDDLRITAQLIDAEDDAHIWAEKFDGVLIDVFSFQEQISQSIVDALYSVFFVPEAVLETGVEIEKRPRLDSPTIKHPIRTNREAYEAYLKGMVASRRFTDAACEEAVDWFDQAIELAPDFAPSYVGKAGALTLPSLGFGVLNDPEKIHRAKAVVDQALMLDSELSGAYTWRGVHAMHFDWDRQAATEAFSRAIELNPNDAEAHFFRANHLIWLEGDHEEALRAVEVVEALDPLNLLVPLGRGWVHYAAGDYETALEEFNSVKTIEPSFAMASYATGGVLVEMGRFEEAIQQFEKCAELAGWTTNVIALLAYTHGRFGDEEKARGYISELEDRSERGFSSASPLAWAYSGLEEWDTVLDWLQKGIETRDPSMIYLSFTHELDPIRNDPRFKDILAEVGLGHLLSETKPRPKG